VVSLPLPELSRLLAGRPLRAGGRGVFGGGTSGVALFLAGLAAVGGASGPRAVRWRPHLRGRAW
jgi:hypothetical protein